MLLAYLNLLFEIIAKPVFKLRSFGEFSLHLFLEIQRLFHGRTLPHALKVRDTVPVF